MSKPPKDDPASIDWGEEANTELDAPVLEEAPTLDEAPTEQITAPHQALAEVDRAFENGREAGFRAGYLACQYEALRFLARMFARSPGGIDESAKHIIQLAREKLTVP